MKNTAFRTKLRETIYNVLKEKEEDEEIESSEEEEVDTDISVSDEETVETDVEEKDTGVVLKLSPTIQGLQKDLQDAFAAAEQLGDTKLVTQIGNTITYFTRTHVVGAGEEVNESAKSRLTKKIFESLKKKLQLKEKEDEEWIQKGEDEGEIKTGGLHKSLGIPKDEKIPKSLINKKLSTLKKKDKEDKEKGVQGLSAKDLKLYRQLNLAKSFAKMDETKSSKKKYVKESLRRKRKSVRRK